MNGEEALRIHQAILQAVGPVLKLQAKRSNISPNAPTG